MTRLLPVVAAVLAVGFSSSAAAQCAWVLWTKLEVAQSPGEWSIREAHSRRDDCIAGMRRAAESARKLGETGHEDIAGGTFALASTPARVIRYGQCLPETIDPRGPKAR